MAIQVGKPAPEAAVDAYARGEPDPRSIKLSSLRGQWVVLFIYPRDFTFVWPTEIRAFARLHTAFHSERAVVIGASTSCPESRKRRTRSHELRPNHRVGRRRQSGCRAKCSLRNPGADEKQCGACVAYQSEIESLLARGSLPGAIVAKLVLDRPGGLRFKRDNPWLADVNFLPYTVLYRDGQRVDAFAASKASYLVERLAESSRNNCIRVGPWTVTTGSV